MHTRISQRKRVKPCNSSSCSDVFLHDRERMGLGVIICTGPAVGNHLKYLAYLNFKCQCKVFFVLFCFFFLVLVCLFVCLFAFSLHTRSHLQFSFVSDHPNEIPSTGLCVLPRCLGQRLQRYAFLSFPFEACLESLVGTDSALIIHSASGKSMSVREPRTATGG